MTVGEKEEKRWRESGEGGDGKDAPWFVRMARGPAWVGRGDRVGLDWMAGGHFAACLPLSSHFPLLPPLPTHVACPCAKGKKENERPSNTQPPILFDHTSGNESAREKWREGRGRKGRRGEKRPGEREKRGERERERKRELSSPRNFLLVLFVLPPFFPSSSDVGVAGRVGQAALVLAGEDAHVALLAPDLAP